MAVENYIIAVYYCTDSQKLLKIMENDQNVADDQKCYHSFCVIMFSSHYPSNYTFVVVNYSVVSLIVNSLYAVVF